jgi:hypothetical protein
MKKRHKPVQGHALTLPADPPGALLRPLPTVASNVSRRPLNGATVSLHRKEESFPV